MGSCFASSYGKNERKNLGRRSRDSCILCESGPGAGRTNSVINCFLNHPAITNCVGFVIVFGFFYLLGRYNLRGAASYHFDPGGESGKFESHSGRYQDIAKLVITLATASAAFIFNFLINISPKSTERGPYSFYLENASKVSIGSFGLSVLCLIVFMIWQTYWYENYSVPGNKDAYTAHRYAISLAFGFSGLFWFLAGYGWRAWSLFVSHR